MIRGRPPLDRESAELVTATADSAVADPRMRIWLTRWFGAWLDERAAVAHRPADDDGRYLLAKYALWHDHATEEDGHGPHQVIGTTDRTLLELIEHAKRMQRAGVLKSVADTTIVDGSSSRAPHRDPNPRQAAFYQPSKDARSRKGRWRQQSPPSKPSKRASHGGGSA